MLKASVAHLPLLWLAIGNWQSAFADEPAASANGSAAAVDAPLYNGRSLSEWRVRIQHLDFDDPRIDWRLGWSSPGNSKSTVLSLSSGHRDVVLELLAQRHLVHLAGGGERQRLDEGDVGRQPP